MIRNQVTERYVRFDGPHYNKLLRKQSVPGSPKYFLKSDIVRLSDESKSTRNTRAGGSNNANDVEMTNADDVACDVCFDDVPLIALIDLGCQGGHRVCAKCVHQWCVEKLPMVCTCPFCREPIRSHEALKRYMTDDMIRLYNSEQTPQNRAEFVFRSADIKFKTFDETSTTEFEHMTDAQLRRVYTSIETFTQYVIGHLTILEEMEYDRNKRRLIRMGLAQQEQLVCMYTYLDHVFLKRNINRTENTQRNDILLRINRDFNTFDPVVTHDDLSQYANRKEYNITIQGKWLLHDIDRKIGMYIKADEYYTQIMTHLFRTEFLRFRFYKWLSDFLANLPSAPPFEISDTIEVNADARDFQFMVHPDCRSYHKFEHHRSKPVKATLKLLLPDTDVHSAIVSRLTSKDTLKEVNSYDNMQFKLHTTDKHPDPRILPVDERLPWIYKFHIDRITSQ